MNLLNQKTYSARDYGSRNLLNMAGHDDEEADPYAEVNLLNSRGVRENEVADPMPVFRPGEVSSAPEKFMPLPDTRSPAATPREAVGILDRIKDAVAGLKDRYDGATRREDGIAELPPDISVGGKDNWGYSKLTLARDNNAAAQGIALKQYPGATIRKDEWGNPIIRLPDGAVRTESHIVDFNEDGFPIIEQKRVPISGEFYLNKPGFTQRDAVNFAAEKAFTEPAALLGGVVGSAAGLGIPGRAAGAALGIEAMDALAQRAGSEEGIDAGDMVNAAVGKARSDVAKYLVKRPRRYAPPD
jgi:hypothetical protein